MHGGILKKIKIFLIIDKALSKQASCELYLRRRGIIGSIALFCIVVYNLATCNSSKNENTSILFIIKNYSKNCKMNSEVTFHKGMFANVMILISHTVYVIHSFNSYSCFLFNSFISLAFS